MITNVINYEYAKNNRNYDIELLTLFLGTTMGKKVGKCTYQ
jgi:hypothetical protein